MFPSFQETEHDKDDSFEDKIDGDLNNLLNQIKEGNQLEGPFSPPANKDKSKDGSGDSLDISKCSRHWQYLYHFPLPQDDTSVHDCNQRHVLLYGVGKGRDDTTRQVSMILNFFSLLLIGGTNRLEWISKDKLL